MKHSLSKKHWQGKSITLESKEHLARLIQEGYEIIEHVFEGTENGINITLLMRSKENQLIANANNIFDYVANCLYLYDYKKRKIAFTWVQNTDIYWDFQKSIVEILEGGYVKPIKVKQIVTNHKKILYNYFAEWIKSEKKLKSALGNLSIISNVCVLSEINQKISMDIISKEKLTLSQIQQIIDKAKSCDNCIAISFFIFTKQLSQINDEKEDLLVGMIIYDIKNNETLSFNIKSMLSFYNKRSYKKSDVLFNVIDELFAKSLDVELNCKSFILTPVNSRWYTPLPWLQYSTLLPIELDQSLVTNSNKDLTIPQFFTFGMITDLQKRGNFRYQEFSSKEDGGFVCILNFNDQEKQIPYNLRFDQSKGERLVHIDFAFRNERDESKIIAHRALDFGDVFNFNRDFFLFVTMAGLFDSYFAAIMRDGLKGMKKLHEQNPAIFSVLNAVWRVERAIDWLNEHKEGYQVLDKLYKEQTLTQSELELTNKIIKNELGIIVPPDDETLLGINMYGLIVLHRFKRGMTNTSLT